MTNFYNCMDKPKLFAFLFHTYNFFHSMQALNANISARLDCVVPSLRDKTSDFPSATPSAKRILKEESTKISSKWKDQQSRGH